MTLARSRTRHITEAHLRKLPYAEDLVIYTQAIHVCALARETQTHVGVLALVCLSPLTDSLEDKCALRLVREERSEGVKRGAYGLCQ